MSQDALLKGFAKKNAGQGFGHEELCGIRERGGVYAQDALRFILPLLQRYDNAELAAVMNAALNAYRNVTRMRDGIEEVFRENSIPFGMFPDPGVARGNPMILEACIYACQVYKKPAMQPA